MGLLDAKNGKALVQAKIKEVIIIRLQCSSWK